MEIDVIQTIKDFTPTESYILTYSIDLQFYEGLVLPMLIRYGCKKNVVVVDAARLSDEIERCPQNIKKMGKEYVIVPIAHQYAFHPKIYLFKKRKKENTSILCLLGSGNLTYPGLFSNKELFSEFMYEGKDVAPKVLEIIKKYIEQCLSANAGESIGLVKKWINLEFPDSFASEDESEKICLFPGENNIFEKFVGNIKEKKVEKIFVSAPFFDHDLSALSRVIERFKPSKIELLLQKGKTLISEEHLKNIIKKHNNFKLLSFDPSLLEAYRYLHAKLLVVTTDKYDYMLAGSSNISDAALFQKKEFGNYEACIYNVQKRDVILKELGIYKISKEISLKNACLPELPILQQYQIDNKEPRIVMAELYSGNLWVTIYGEHKKKSLNAVCLFSNGGIKKIILQKKVQEKALFFCKSSEVDGVIAIKSLSDYARWVPIIHLLDIEQFSKEYNARVEKIKSKFLEAMCDENQQYYLNVMIDHLVGQACEVIAMRDKDKSSSSIRSKGKRKQEEGEIIVNIEDASIAKDHRNEYASSLNGGFTDSLTYLLSALKERQYNTSVDAETVDSEQQEVNGLQEYDDKMVEKQEEQVSEEVVSDLKWLSSILKKHQRNFLKFNTRIDSVSLTSFFLLVAMPSIPYLHRFYIDVSQAKKECVDDVFWERFIMASIEKIAQRMFSFSVQTEPWPPIKFNILKVEMLNINIAAYVYVLATVYSFLRKRASGFREQGIEYAKFSSQALLVGGAFMNVARSVDANFDTALRKQLSDVMVNFPCDWLNIQNDVDTYIEEVDTISQHDFTKSSFEVGYGKIVFVKQKGFLLEKNSHLYNLLTSIV
ncbi:MAG: hypothetical protein P9M06_06425 [Candidatus Saelkia tenebricola]|nr:hypothetical protein [Candidatus Saelkia tenebricola]